jgi:hypothetical protein
VTIYAFVVHGTGFGATAAAGSGVRVTSDGLSRVIKKTVGNDQRLDRLTDGDAFPIRSRPTL